jgi:hypothetical protein
MAQGLLLEEGGAGAPARRGVVSPVRILAQLHPRYRDYLDEAYILAHELGPRVELEKLSGPRRREVAGAIISAVRMPSGNLYTILELRVSEGLLRRFSSYSSLQRALMEYYSYRRDGAILPFLRRLTRLDEVEVLKSKPLMPTPATLMGALLYDYFRLVDEVKTYRDVVARLEPLARNAGAIGAGVEDVKQAVEVVKAQLEALLAKVDSMTSILLRLADRTAMLQKLLEGYNQPELRPVKVVAEQVAEAVEELSRAAQDIRSLPSFAQGNPWLELLSRGRQGGQR